MMPGHAGGGDDDVGALDVLGPVGHAGVHEVTAALAVGRFWDSRIDSGRPIVTPRPRITTSRPATGIS